tara:strand:+ start:1969 stop:3180 length:1212 start_codon:yes stop_codon:yes gene_type:complete
MIKENIDKTVLSYLYYNGSSFKLIDKIFVDILLYDKLVCGNSIVFKGHELLTKNKLTVAEKSCTDNFLWCVPLSNKKTIVTSDNSNSDGSCDEISLIVIDEKGIIENKIILNKLKYNIPINAPCVGGVMDYKGDSWLSVFAKPSGLIHYTKKNKLSWYPLIINTRLGIYSPNIHNCYEFKFENFDKAQIFGAVIGNFFEDTDENKTKPTRGYGLVRFDRKKKKWSKKSIKNALPLHIRSAKQMKESNFVAALTQNYGGSSVKNTESELYILNYDYCMDSWTIFSKYQFYSPPGSEGGADVILGPYDNSFFVTIRSTVSNESYLYYLELEGHKLINKNSIALESKQPRYMTNIDDDIYLCNEEDQSLTIYRGLFKNPYNVQKITIPSECISEDIKMLYFIKTVY